MAICALILIHLCSKNYAQSTELIEDSLVIYASACMQNVVKLTPSVTDSVHSTDPPTAFNIYAILEGKEWILLLYDGTGVYSYSMGRKSQQIRRNPIATDVNLCEIIAREYIEPVSKDKKIQVGDYRINNYYKFNKVGKSLYKATLLFNQGKRSMGPVLDSFRGLYSSDFFKKPKKKMSEAKDQIDNLEDKIDQKDKDLATMQKEIELLREKLKKQEEDSAQQTSSPPNTSPKDSTSQVELTDSQVLLEDPPTSDTTKPLKPEPILVDSTNLSAENPSDSVGSSNQTPLKDPNTDTFQYPIIEIEDPKPVELTDTSNSSTNPIPSDSLFKNKENLPTSPPETEIYTGKEDSIKSIKDSLNRKLEDLKKIIEERKKKANQTPNRSQGKLFHKMKQSKNGWNIDGIIQTPPPAFLDDCPLELETSLADSEIVTNFTSEYQLFTVENYGLSSRRS